MTSSATLTQPAPPVSVELPLPAQAALAQVRSGLAGLQKLDLTSPDNEQLIELLRQLEVLRRLLPVFDHRLVAELTDRRLDDRRFAPSPQALLRTVLRLSPRQAAARVRAARLLGPRVSLQGERLPAKYPRVVAAQEAGSISAEHAAVITDCLQRLPRAVVATEGDAAEATLVNAAAQFNPRDLITLARRLTDVLDPDATLTDDSDVERNRRLTIAAERRGGYTITGHLTTDCGALWCALLDALAAPQPGGPTSPDTRTAPERIHDAFADYGAYLSRGTTHSTTAAGHSDTGRGGGSAWVAPDAASEAHPSDASAAEAQRSDDCAVATSDGAGAHGQDSEDAHDLLAWDSWDEVADCDCCDDPGGPHHPGDPHHPEGGDAAAHAPVGTEPAEHDRDGAPLPASNLVEKRLSSTAMSTVLVIVANINDLQAGTGYATTGQGDLIPIKRALELLGPDGRSLSVVFDAHGAILDYGRQRRLAPPGMRLALIARDRGCTVPGCDIPASWCQAHHLREWTADKGPTAIRNLGLVCGYHHRNYRRLGWQSVMVDAVPHWIAARHVDPSQTPRRNTLHHPELLLDP